MNDNISKEELTFVEVLVNIMQNESFPVDYKIEKKFIDKFNRLTNEKGLSNKLEFKE